MNREHSMHTSAQFSPKYKALTTQLAIIHSLLVREGPRLSRLREMVSSRNTTHPLWTRAAVNVSPILATLPQPMPKPEGSHFSSLKINNDYYTTRASEG